MCKFFDFFDSKKCPKWHFWPFFFGGCQSFLTRCFPPSQRSVTWTTPSPLLDQWGGVQPTTCPYIEACQRGGGYLGCCVFSFNFARLLAFLFCAVVLYPLRPAGWSSVLRIKPYNSSGSPLSWNGKCRKQRGSSSIRR